MDFSPSPGKLVSQANGLAKGVADSPGSNNYGAKEREREISYQNVSEKTINLTLKALFEHIRGNIYKKYPRNIPVPHPFR